MERSALLALALLLGLRHRLCRRPAVARNGFRAIPARARHSGHLLLRGPDLATAGRREVPTRGRQPTEFEKLGRTVTFTGSMNTSAAQPVEICGRDAHAAIRQHRAQRDPLRILPERHNQRATCPRATKRQNTQAAQSHGRLGELHPSRGTPKCSTDEAFIETATVLHVPGFVPAAAPGALGRRPGRNRVKRQPGPLPQRVDSPQVSRNPAVRFSLRFTLAALLLAPLARHGAAEDKLPEGSAPYPGWQHLVSIWILTTPEGVNLPTASLETGFPLLVRLHKDFFDFSQAKANGEDVRFSTTEEFVGLGIQIGIGG